MQSNNNSEKHVKRRDCFYIQKLSKCTLLSLSEHIFVNFPPYTSSLVIQEPRPPATTWSTYPLLLQEIVASSCTQHGKDFVLTNTLILSNCFRGRSKVRFGRCFIFHQVWFQIRFGRCFILRQV